MDLRQFYGRRPSYRSRFVISDAVPDDGNISDTGDVSSDDDDDETDSDSDADILYHAVNDSDNDSDSTDMYDTTTAHSDEDDADQWSDKYTPKSFNLFAKDSGPFIVLPPDAEPLDYFEQLFPETLWTRLATETNRYATEKAPAKAQYDTDVKELKAFIALTMAMSIHQLPRMKNYWSDDWVLSVPQFRQVFTRDRYLYLFYNVHMVDNSTALPCDDPSHDRLFKIRPLITKLNETFQEAYSPSKNVSVDESMVRFKGRSSLKQYLPMKPIKRGFKIWCLSCSGSGYLLQFRIYTGKDAEQPGSLAERVVVELVVPLCAKSNCTVFMDNFFTSLPLMKRLAEEGIHTCGTFRSNRVGFPAALKDTGNVKQLKRGDAMFRYKGDTTALVWMDRKPVFVVSNAHSPIMESVRRKNKDGSVSLVNCPTIVADYNRYMGGVDLNDQLKSYYQYNRKSRRWWLRLFFHLLDVTVVNAYILYLQVYRIHCHPPQKYRPIDQLSFRCRLIDQLVDHFSCRKEKGRVSKTVVSLVPSGHNIVDLRQYGVPSGRCEYCSIGKYKYRKRKETQFGCRKCNKRLCPTGCWTDFHKKHLPHGGKQ